MWCTHRTHIPGEVGVCVAGCAYGMLLAPAAGHTRPRACTCTPCISSIAARARRSDLGRSSPSATCAQSRCTRVLPCHPRSHPSRGFRHPLPVRDASVVREPVGQLVAWHLYVMPQLHFSGPRPLQAPPYPTQARHYLPVARALRPPLARGHVDGIQRVGPNNLADSLPAPASRNGVPSSLHPSRQLAGNCLPTVYSGLVARQPASTTTELSRAAAAFRSSTRRLQPLQHILAAAFALAR